MISLSHWYGRLGNVSNSVPGTLWAEQISSTFHQTLDHDIIKKHQSKFEDFNVYIVDVLFWGP